MKIINETSLINFEFWSGAICRANQLTGEEMERLEIILDELFPEGMTDTQINDLFWFDFETICEWLCLELDDNGDVIRNE